MSASVLIYHPESLRHVLAPGHVESPLRLKAILAKFETLGLLHDVETPEAASRADVRTIHSSSYVDLVETFGDGYLDADTPIHEETASLALLAVGGAVRAALASAGTGRPTLALVRPPGHHAGPDYGGGFCFYNNVAVAAHALRARFPRVAILDFDAHHGNGTSDIFAARRDVLYVSTHQFGIYPGTGPAGYAGDGPGEGYTVNIPFSAGAGDASFALAFREVIEPVVRQFRPSAVLVSLGADAHYRDPLTQLGLSSRGFASVVEATLAIGRAVAHGRVSFVLEGGYDLPALAEVCAGTYAQIRGESVPLQYTEGRDEEGRGRQVVERVKKVHAAYWDL